MKFLYTVFTLFLIVICSFGFVSLVSAHQPQTSNGVSAVLYFDPHHSPIPGDKVIAIIDFSKSEKKFDVPACDCAITVNGNTIPTSVQKKTADMITFPYTFEEGEYNVQIKSAEISMEFKVVVAQDETAHNHGASHKGVAHYAHLIIYSIGFIVALVLIYRTKEDK